MHQADFRLQGSGGDNPSRERDVGDTGLPKAELRGSFHQDYLYGLVKPPCLDPALHFARAF